MSLSQGGGGGGGGGSPGGSANHAQLNDGAGGFAGVAPGTSGNLFQSNATTWQSVAPSFNTSVLTAGTLGTARGGTGTTTLTFPGGTDTLVGRASTDTLTNKTLTSPTISSPTISGTTTFSGASIQATGNARARPYSDIANVQTTDATVTTLFSWTILDEATTKVVSEVCGCRSTGAETAAYVRQSKIKRDGGTVTFGTVDAPFTQEDVSTWDHTLDNSTSTGRGRVTGVNSVTIDWGGVFTRLEVSHA